LPVQLAEEPVIEIPHVPLAPEPVVVGAPTFAAVKITYPVLKELSALPLTPVTLLLSEPQTILVPFDFNT